MPEALLEGPLQFYLYSVEHDNCLNSVFKFRIRVMYSIYISRDPRMCAQHACECLDTDLWIQFQVPTILVDCCMILYDGVGFRALDERDTDVFWL